MTDQSELYGSVVPFCRQWHVIHEVDLVRLAADHAMLRRLCNELEACADALPLSLSPQQLQSLCQRLREFVAKYEVADEVLLKTIFGRNPTDKLTRSLICHIQARHAADAAHAHDLITALDPQAADHDRFSVEALAYMLRCFFDGCRRAMDFEELTILMLGGNRLTPNARELLVSGLSRTAQI
ncbi:hypothetical protein BH09PSE3_BH09PSE3_10500 [soil metagenome]